MKSLLIKDTTVKRNVRLRMPSVDTKKLTDRWHIFLSSVAILSALLHKMTPRDSSVSGRKYKEMKFGNVPIRSDQGGKS